MSLDKITEILNEWEKQATVSLTFTLDRFLSTELARQSPLSKQAILVWDKKNPGLGWVVRKAQEGWKPTYPIPSILAFPRTDARYATSKPVALMVVLLEAVGLPVVDLFPGGGSAKTASEILGLNYRAVGQL